jgi:hypothetical protein
MERRRRPPRDGVRAPVSSGHRARRARQRERRRWWRGAAIAGLCGLGLGAIASLPFASTGIPVPVLAVAFAAFAVNGWALSGGRP